MVRIKLAELLARKKMSRADLSKITGIRYNTINDLYYEMAISIKFEQIELICTALDCDVNDFIQINKWYPKTDESLECIILLTF